MLLLFLHMVVVYFIFARSKFLQVEGWPSWIMPCILFLKVWGGYFVARYYLSTYQGGDIQGYLNDANQFYKLFISSPGDFFKVMLGMEVDEKKLQPFFSQLAAWFSNGYAVQYNDARSVVRFHSFIRLVSNGNEWIHLIWSNVFCVGGMVALLRFFNHGSAPVGMIGASVGLIFFLPNVFVWSSSILKEPLLVFALGMTLRSFQIWTDQRNFKKGMTLLFFVVCFLLVKSFWLLALLPGLMVWAWRPHMKHVFKTMLATYAVALLVILIVGEYVLSVNVPDLLFGQQRNMWRYVVYLNSGSLIHPLSFAPTPVSFLKHIPEAFCTGMFQPWPWQLAKWFYFPIQLENMVIPVLLCWVIIRNKVWEMNWSKASVVALFAGVIIVVVSAFTTPVIGSLIRYRMPGMLLMVMALMPYLFPVNRKTTGIASN